MRLRSVFALSLLAAPAFAADPGPSSQPAGAPPKLVLPTPGPETKALEPLVGTHTFEGVKRPGGVETKDSMTMTCKWTAAGMFIFCEDKGAPPAPGMPPFEGGIVLGYDYIAKQYTGYETSMQGIGVALVGQMQGKKLVLENLVDIVTPSGKARMRTTIDFTDPKKVKMISERGPAGGPLAEFATHVQKG
jgi:hypothetical protein